MNAPVPFCDLARAHAPIRAELDRAIRDCLDRSTFLRGPQTQAFEEEWAAYCGQRFAVACNSGTDALTIAATALGLREVVVPANTLPLTALGLHKAGAHVVLGDVDDEGWLSAPDSLGGTAVPVLLYGRLPRRDDPVARLYDAAHAHGWKPAPGSVATWSFYPTKTLGALGDGGAVTTDDEGLAGQMRELCGRDDQLRNGRQLTSRMDEIQAAVLRVKLRHLDTWLATRRELADCYHHALAPLGVTLPGASLHHLYVIRVPDRNALQHRLAACAIGSKVHWPTPLSGQAGPWQSPGVCPGAERWCSRVLSLPCYPGLQDEEQARVIEVVLDHVARPAGPT